jgi:cytochrome P450
MEGAVGYSASPVPGVARLDVDPFDDAFLRDPYSYHAAIRDAGPVIWLDRYGIYAAARHAEVASALNDWKNFVSARGVGLSDFASEEPWRAPSLLLETDPPIHDRTRRIMAEVVSLAKLKALAPIWRAEAETLVDDLVMQGRFDAVTHLGESFPLRIFPKAVGLQEGGETSLLNYAAATFNAFGPRNAIFWASNDAAKDAIDWVSEACRRENLAKDGWGMEVYKAADAGRCTKDEAHRLVRSLLSAGLDTTVNGIGNMVYAFATNPDQWSLLRQTRTLKKKAFEESLRWESTVQTFFRTTQNAVELGGICLPANAKVLLFLAAANRDPRRWRNPDEFDIDRTTSGHVGFGFGIHQCLGQMVARLEAEVVLDAMLPRVEQIRLNGEPVRRLNNTLRAFQSMPVEVLPASRAGS